MEAQALAIGHDQVLIRNWTAAFSIGQRILFTGANGTGKTTLLHSLFESALRKGGELHIRISPCEIAFVEQKGWKDFPLPLTVKETIQAFAQTLSRGEYSRSQIKSLEEEMRLEPLHGRLLQELSGGEAQRLRLALAFLQDPKILLLDEPFSAMDRDSKEKVFASLERRRSTTLQIFVVHDLLEALQLHGQILRIENQEIRPLARHVLIDDLELRLENEKRRASDLV